MAYIGIDPNVGDITFQKFTGDGSATAFTLAQNVASGEAVVVTIGNVVQEPGASAAYTAYGNTLTFSAAPANGDIITVRYFGRAVDQPLSYAMQLFKFVATASQTVFTGADNAGAILAFSGNDVDVYLNGVHLDTTDYTPTSGTTITLATAAALNDELVIRAYRAFSVTDTVSAASGGTFNGGVTFEAGANFGDNDKAVFGAGAGDLEIYSDGTYSRIMETGGQFLVLDTNGSKVSLTSDNSKVMGDFIKDGAVQLRHNGSQKFSTTATGVDVTGTALAHTVEIGDGSAGGTSEVVFSDNVSGRAKILYDHGASPNEEMGFEIAGTRYMTIENGGNVGIGESSPQKTLHITRNDSDGMIVLDANGATTDHQICFSKNYGTGGTTGGNYWGIGVDGSENKLVFAYDPNAQASLAADAKMVLDSSGNVLVGKTASNVAVAGAEIRSSGFTGLTVDGGAGLTIRRLTSDGELQSFFKDTTKVGSIGNTGTEFFIGTPSGSDGYIRFQSQGLVPCTSTGANSDGTMQLGTSSGRFSDLYLSGSAYVDGIAAAAQSEHFIFSESTGGTFPYHIAMKRGFTQTGIATTSTLTERGGINGSGILSDGKTSIVAVSGTSNPGGTFFDIFTLGNQSAGNSGFTTLSWSNEDGTLTGSASRANMAYNSQTPSSNSRWSRRWTVSQSTSYTGTHPKNIIDDGYIQITFS